MVLCRIFFIDQFVVPGYSMYPTLIKGDRILVNKFIFGARIYDSFDFSDNSILKSHRVKGIRNIRRNDVLVFNFPVNKKTGKIEFKINYVYVKRCIGLPKDIIEIREGYFINNNYKSQLGNIFEQSVIHNIPDSLLDNYRMNYNIVDDNNFEWTIKNFGPIQVPGKGLQIKLDSRAKILYKNIIEYETGRQICFDNSLYPFKKNYYFVCGDNLRDSYDSRHWGFVPEEFIIGVVNCISYSRDESDNIIKHRILKRLPEINK